MSYTDQKNVINLTPTAASVTATGNLGNSYEPAFGPEIVRKFAVLPVTTAGVYTSLQVNLYHISLVSGSTASAIDIIYGTATDYTGRVVYAKDLNVTINPGDRIYANCQAAATTASTNVKCYVMTEPKWDVEANSTDMRVTT